MTKICIATGSFFHPQETQISFHIENLFGGNVCVLNEYDMNPNPYGVEHHSWMPPKVAGPSMRQRLSILSSKVASIAQHRTARVPNGKAMDGIQTFFDQARPDAILA